MNRTQTLDQRFEIIVLRAKAFAAIFVEIWKGLVAGDKRLFGFLCCSLTFAIAVLVQADVWLFQYLKMWSFYPLDGFIFKFYAVIVVWMPVFAFGALVCRDKKKFAEKLKEVFTVIGLKNSLGSVPKFLSLESLSGGTMKLRVTNGAFTLDEWVSKKSRLEANLRVYIDEFRAIPDKGIVEITFSYEAMPTKVTIENIMGYRDSSYLIGRDRTKTYKGSFVSSPHLLIAGSTGGGKSVFMRQLITTIKVNEPETQFKLVDLKGGVEFGHFEKFPDMTVVSETDKVAAELRALMGDLEVRTKALKDRRLTKIDDFFKTDEYRRMSFEQKRKHVLGRRVITVVDECADIFLFGGGQDAKLIREIRSIMSSIARKGRFVGLHLIVGTQRPDKQAVDPQVKSNLTTTVCFRIPDIGGSLAILGNGRAVDLPQFPGRCILREGSSEYELQAPLMEFDEAMRILEQKFPESLEDQKNIGPKAKSNDSEGKVEEISASNNLS